MGDITMSCFAHIIHSLTAFSCGWQLERLMAETRETIKRFENLRQSHLSYLLIQRQMLENLRCPSADPCCFTGRVLNEERWKEKAKLTNDGPEQVIFRMCKSFVALYFGEYVKAKQFTKELMGQTLTGAATVICQSYFLDALIDVVVARETGCRARKYKSSFGKLQFYFKHAPDNVINKILLIEAERAVLQGRRTVAMTKFRQSIDNANRLGLIHEEALAYERFAVALLEWEDMTQALEYFERAKNLYEHWGSPVKVQQLVKVVQEKTGMTNSLWR